MIRIYILTNFIRGSKEYIAGLLPEASSTNTKRPSSTNFLLNFAAVFVGTADLLVNLLFLKTGFVNTKSKALILYFEDNASAKTVFISS